MMSGKAYVIEMITLLIIGLLVWGTVGCDESTVSWKPEVTPTPEPEPTPAREPAATPSQGPEFKVTRHLPYEVQAGETFEVTVTFTAPADDFNSFGPSDIAPAGWDVTVSKNWCRPEAFAAKAAGRTAEYLWMGPYDRGQEFTAVYKVKVPSDAKSGTYTFGQGRLDYFLAGAGPYGVDITGDSEVGCW